MNINRDELKLVIKNELTEKLPGLVPGLTKTAYEELIQNTVDSLPDNLEKFDKYSDSLEKKAAAPLSFGAEIAKGIGGGIGGAAAAALMGAAIYGIRNTIQASQTNALRPAYEHALKMAMASTDPAGEILRNNRQKCVSFGNTIFSFAPHVATDPNILKGVLAHVVQGESIDPQTVRSLMELEEKRKNLLSFKPGDIAFKG